MRLQGTLGPVVLVAATAAALTGCTPGPDYVAVCTDKRTQTRVNDRDCRSNTSTTGFQWYYLNTANTEAAPRVGSRVTGGSFTTPHAKPGSSTPTIARAGSVSPDGAITRGGFGSSSSGKTSGS